jgi:HPt (histidine-containing phosphotransfer) domain-containing protein
MNTTTTYTNLSYLRLMADNDEEMVQTMLGMLLEELPEELDKIKALHEEKNWEELGKISHKMKSTLAFVGNEPMTNANKEIEQLAKSGAELDKIGSLIAILDHHAPAVLKELKLACQVC